MGWPLIIILAVILGLLIALAEAWRRTRGPGPPPPPPPWIATGEQLQDQITALQESGNSPTSDECTTIKNLLQQMIDEGAPSTSTTPLQSAIDRLCPP
ncbi:MAG: hypothetical protein GKR91_09480 [Pseudomonadales bacterium]|nr:hypothetical protein [Pseudomonadales bacterium]